MVILLKTGGLAIGLLGLLLTLLDLLGKFRDHERTQLVQRIRDGQEIIDRSTPGFAKFLRSFPPPAGIDPNSVAQIAWDRIQTHDGYPVAITVRYLVNNTRTEPVAAFPDVVAWADRTPYRWWAIGVAFLGWVAVAVGFALEFFAY